MRDYIYKIITKIKQMAHKSNYIEKVLPDVVTTRDNGYKAVKYEKLVPLLIEAIKDLSRQVDGLKRLI